MLRLLAFAYTRNMVYINQLRFCQDKQKKSQTVSQLQPKDFSLIDLRIGQIVSCWKHPSSQQLYCQKIKILSEPQKIVEIASGLQKFVSLENMRGKVLVMANLKPRKMGGFASQGMLICTSTSDKSITQMIVPVGQIGERIFLENHEQYFPASNQILPILNPKKKILQKCLEDFRTDGDGYVVWKNIKLKCKNGYLKTDLKNALVC